MNVSNSLLNLYIALQVTLFRSIHRVTSPVTTPISWDFTLFRHDVILFCFVYIIKLGKLYILIGILGRMSDPTSRRFSTNQFACPTQIINDHRHIVLFFEGEPTTVLQIREEFVYSGSTVYTAALRGSWRYATIHHFKRSNSYKLPLGAGYMILHVCVVDLIKLHRVYFFRVQSIYQLQLHSFQ